MSFAILTDTSANLPTPLLQKHGVTVAPFSNTYDGAEHTCLDTGSFDGAAYYGVVRRGGGIRIGGGTARSFYVGLEGDPHVDAAVAERCARGEHVQDDVAGVGLLPVHPGDEVPHRLDEVQLGLQHGLDVIAGGVDGFERDGLGVPARLPRRDGRHVGDDRHEKHQDHGQDA